MVVFQFKQKVMNNQDFQNILKRIDSLKVDVSPKEHILFNSMIYFGSPLISLLAFHLLILENSK
jgi:hypothetical protein